ncbi:hypothetical protein VT85_17370 [Planctomyces sp. SH-PL62]|nr:hypothetical protein VT85_17370 [Planctomyces sp. SH-PL62]
MGELRRVDGLSRLPNLGDAENETGNAAVDVLRVLVSVGERPLDTIPLLVDLAHVVVPNPELFAVAPVRDHRHGVEGVSDHVADGVGVQALVAENLASHADRITGPDQDGRRRRGIVPSALDDVERHDAVLVAGDGDHLPAARPTESLCLAAPFSQRARTTVESIISRWASSHSARSAVMSKSRLRRPEWIQRQSRLLDGVPGPELRRQAAPGDAGAGPVGDRLEEPSVGRLRLGAQLRAASLDHRAEDGPDLVGDQVLDAGGSVLVVDPP